jgi:hypothetical protein
MITRLIFCAPYRIPIATVSLKFDYNLLGVSRNIIVSPVNDRDLFKYLSRYGIDTNRFEHIQDQDLIDRYPDIARWSIDGDPRNDWLKQQALKLAALDYIDYSVALIHDPDTWMTEPYQCINDDRLNMLVQKNVTEGSYDSVLPDVLKIQRQSPHCFVTEFMPVKKSIWTSLKTHVEQLHNKPFLQAIIDNVPFTPSFNGGPELKWFSEYEFIGNWTLTQEAVDYVYQRRFSFTNLDDLDCDEIGNCNSICDQSPGYQLTLGFDDWHTGNIPNYDRCIDILKKYFTML